MLFADDGCHFSLLAKRYWLRYVDRCTRRLAIETVTVPSKFQVMIPKAIREELRIRPGQKVQAVAYRGRIELIPIRAIKELRGSLKGMDASDPRDHEERE
jgi:AbrB family looped-hinge helix DNA binding protein